uniref:AAA+ ATPase domain-containing protein n=1 Tax=Guillardia theta TaxID=55529 RepID=A0A7S4UPR8_GUITH|mmetsp:Transcript_42171/g.132843  ORF Transcript_42171/g.132843 Transcript_42171/m.132843 type:complete len:471 (+) Transcript_42171:302-1714(+)
MQMKPKKAIQERLSRISPVLDGAVLPWQCKSLANSTKVSFKINPGCDQFFILMTSVFEMSASKRTSDAKQSVEGGMRAWDDEKTSSGFEVSLLCTHDRKATIRVVIPWKNAELPEVEIEMEGGGFTREEAFAVGRMIHMGNLSPMQNELMVMKDMMTPFGPAVPWPKAQDHLTSNHSGNSVESIISQMEEMGAQVFHSQKGRCANISWDYLSGIDDIKQEVEDTIMLLMLHPEKYARVISGTRADSSENNRPKAVLFEGPPGCGKTTMARMIANKADIPMIYLPLEAVVSKWYGEAEKRLSSIMDLTGKLADLDRNKGALLFLDEIEALAVSRDGEIHEASRRMLSVLLRTIDGFQTKDGLIVIGATNRVGDIDSALRSRFDVSIKFDLPDEQSRKQIVARMTRHLSGLEQQKLAQRMAGFSGRNIRDVCEQAERRWAAKIIRGKAPEDQLPPMEEYISAIQSRINSGLQ